MVRLTLLSKFFSCLFSITFFSLQTCCWEICVIVTILLAAHSLQLIWKQGRINGEQRPLDSRRNTSLRNKTVGFQHPAAALCSCAMQWGLGKPKISGSCSIGMCALHCFQIVSMHRTKYSWKVVVTRKSCVYEIFKQVRHETRVLSVTMEAEAKKEITGIDCRILCAIRRTNLLQTRRQSISEPIRR